MPSHSLQFSDKYTCRRCLFCVQF